MNVDAAALARGWLSVFAATGDEKAEPQLRKTIHIDQFPHGIRLAATDKYMLLHCWIPEADFDLDDLEPGLFDTPFASATVYDTNNRGGGLLKYLLGLSRSDDHKGLECAIRLNVPWQPDDHGDETQIEGFEALAVVLEVSGMERVQLEVYEGGYPAWQTVVDAHRVQRARDISISPDLMGRLVKAANVHHSTLNFYFGGKGKPIAVNFGREPQIRGLVMPTFWDFSTNAPWVKPAPADDETTDPSEPDPDPEP